MYFQGKHVPLVLMALLIILIGVPYTLLLFLWQWLVHAPNSKVFKWIRNSKLNAFVSVRHIPYNSKYHYWTGLLLLLRVVYILLQLLYPETLNFTFDDNLFTWNSLYDKGSHRSEGIEEVIRANAVEMGLYMNLLAISAFSLVGTVSKLTLKKQTAVGCTSTIITFILLIGVLVYHMYLVLRKDQPLGEDTNVYPLAPGHSAKAQAQVSHSVIEIPEPHDSFHHQRLASCNTCTTVIGFTYTTTYNLRHSNKLLIISS